MTDQLRQAAQQALEVLNTAYFPDIEEGMTAYNALRAALEQPQQTPVWAITPPNASGSTQVIIRWQVETPQGWVGSWDREALEWLTTTCKGRLQVEQPQQEPVALTEAEKTELLDWVSACQSAYSLEQNPRGPFFAPPGQLEENRQALVDYVNDVIAARAAPQPDRLKEKNHG